MFKHSMTKGRTIVNFQQINGKLVPDEASTHKVRVSSTIDLVLGVQEKENDCV